MKTVYMGGLTLLILLLLMGSASAATIDVGPSGYTYTSIASGMSAASSGDTVYVHAGTYVITTPVVMKSGVTLKGDGYSNTIISVTDKSKFASESSWAMITASSCSNIEIYGFKFKGPASSVSDIHDSTQTYYGGHDDYHAAIRIAGCDDVDIHDCYYTLLLGDGVRTSSSGNTNVNIYNNIFDTTGHDAIQAWGSSGWRIYNNYISVMINCGVRVANSPSSSIEIDHNTFTNGLTNSGWTGVQIQGTTTGLNVHHNVFTEMTDNYGVTTYSSTASGCTISNNIGYLIPSGIVYSCGSATASNNTVYGAEHDWASWGYGYNAVSSPVPEDPDPIGGGGTGGGGVDTPSTAYAGSPLPALISPSNTATVTPVNGNVSFSWSNVNSTLYHIQVSTVSNFASTVYDVDTFNTAISLALNSGTTYYWKAKAYNDAGATWTAYTASQTVTTATNIVATSGVYGTIYQTGLESPVSGAVVTMYNDTWSGTDVTGLDGHYEFSIYATGAYYVSVSATEYQSSLQMPVNVVASSYVERNVALVKSPTYFAPHNVKLVVTDKLMMNRYNATVNVYKDDATTALYTAETGTDGTVTFELDEVMTYRIETLYYGATQIDNIMPVDNVYYILLDSIADNVLPAKFYDETNITVTKSVINATSAYINVTYVDLYTTRTNSLNVTVGQHDLNGTYIPIGVGQTFTGAQIIAGSGIVTASFIVTNYLGESYTERIIIDHDNFGVITKWHADAFKGSNLPFDGKMLAYFGVFLLFIIAMQFGRAEHATGAILLCGVFWLMYGVGTFEGFGEAITSIMAGGGSLATIYAVTAYINDKRREEGI